MKRTVTIIILIIIALVFGGSLYYLYQKNQDEVTRMKLQRWSYKEEATRMKLPRWS